MATGCVRLGIAWIATRGGSLMNRRRSHAKKRSSVGIPRAPRRRATCASETCTTTTRQCPRRSDIALVIRAAVPDLGVLDLMLRARSPQAHDRSRLDALGATLLRKAGHQLLQRIICFSVGCCLCQ